MKNHHFSIAAALVVLIICLLSSGCAPAADGAGGSLSVKGGTAKLTAPTTEQKTTGVTQAAPATDYTTLLAAVSANTVFDGDITASPALIEEACLPLLDKAVEGEQSLIIEQGIVGDYIYDLYGITVDPSVLQYDFLTAPEGYYPILPRGYAEITHAITSTVQNDDGTLTVYTDMTVNFGGDDCDTLHAQTVLRPNSQSSFGYNVLSAVILEDLI